MCSKYILPFCRFSFHQFSRGQKVESVYFFYHVVSLIKDFTCEGKKVHQNRRYIEKTVRPLEQLLAAYFGQTLQ